MRMTPVNPGASSRRSVKHRLYRTDALRNPGGAINGPTGEYGPQRGERYAVATVAKSPTATHELNAHDTP